MRPGSKRADETRTKTSATMREYWDSPEGRLRRRLLAEVSAVVKAERERDVLVEGAA